MEYKYDVFISYKRTPQVFGPWVQKVFYPFFKEYLIESLGPKCEIFLDEKEIRNGEEWKERIETSLVTSRHMVAILIPSYFDSEWCKNEYSIMLSKSQELNQNKKENPYR